MGLHCNKDRSKEGIMKFCLRNTLECYHDEYSWRYHRLICKIKGCKIYHENGGWNMPMEAYTLGCSRCLSFKSNYEGESAYKIIESDECLNHVFIEVLKKIIIRLDQYKWGYKITKHIHIDI